MGDIMITCEQVQEAKTNEVVMNTLYKEIFYDGNKPKLRMWLINSGISYDELDDLETEMKISFLCGVKKYSHGKIPFEKFVWTKFRHTLLNHFQNKKLKKNADLDYVDFDTVNVADDDADVVVDDDYEALFMCLPKIEATICRLLYYNDWKKYQIIQYLQISSKAYDRYIEHIQKRMKKYLF